MVESESEFFRAVTCPSGAVLVLALEQVIPESPSLTARTGRPGWGSVQASVLPSSRGHLLRLGRLTAAQLAPGRLIKVSVAHTLTHTHCSRPLTLTPRLSLSSVCQR